MELLPTELPDVLVVRPTVRHDERGSVRFVWNSGAWSDAGLLTQFALENRLISHQWVLRGIHRQMSQPLGNLVRCLVARVFDVAVDLLAGAPNFGRWVGQELEADSGESLWVPPGFGPGVPAAGAALSQLALP